MRQDINFNITKNGADESLINKPTFSKNTEKPTIKLPMMGLYGKTTSDTENIPIIIKYTAVANNGFPLTKVSHTNIDKKYVPQNGSIIMLDHPTYGYGAYTSRVVEYYNKKVVILKNITEEDFLWRWVFWMRIINTTWLIII